MPYAFGRQNRIASGYISPILDYREGRQVGLIARIQLRFHKEQVLLVFLDVHRFVRNRERLDHRVSMFVRRETRLHVLPISYLVLFCHAILRSYGYVMTSGCCSVCNAVCLVPREHDDISHDSRKQ